MATIVISPLFLDIVFSLVIIVLGFVIFVESLSDYRLVSAIKRIMAKRVIINPVNVKQYAIIQLYQRGMIRGYFKVVDAALKDPSIGSILISEDKVLVKLAEGIRTPVDTELLVTVSVRGRLDEYYIRSGIKINVKLAE
ncbi:hypothetical protein [Caldivirga maquilingensis]|uniref:Uncharacterized protein n=1 Tax=Caldivirga maquilingensis (strain ATCC 700844 / DSM 13496 / JCM 10307 / IC-167) TaxID=397948 RepID=A8MDJ3_CALMQ|nr:hypothetical protein [Caldivirga maquilingensis]ABW01849.1 hypothetical protein Cmaq_1018 [Caldivirga maquilingensis IC-167]